jgi:Tol biopolymer transport system component
VQLGGAWSPDGTKVVLQEARVGLDHAGQLVVHDLDTDATTELVDLSGEPRAFFWLAPRFSGDGRRVVFQLAQMRQAWSAFDTWSVPVTGGVPQLEMRDAAFPVPLGDGRVIVVSGLEGLFGDQTATLSILDADGVVNDVVDVDHAPWHLTASPDGTRVAYVEEHGTGDRIHVVDLETGENRVVGTGEGVDWLDDDTILVSSTA